MKVRQAIAMAAHVAARQTTLPVLQTVRIDGNTITATDLETQIDIPTDLPPELDRAFCVHAQRLGRVLKALPEEADLKLKLEGDRLHLSAGSTRYELQTLAAADFPTIAQDDVLDQLTVQAAEIVRGIEFCRPAIAAGDVRYYLNGLHMHLQPSGIVLTATDGHRMHRARVPIAIECPVAEAIIPGVTVARLVEVASQHAEITFGIAHDLIYIETAGETLKAKLIEGRFPDADRVIPADRPVTGQLRRKPFIEALRRVAVLAAGEKTDGVAIHFRPDKVTLTARNSHQELAEATFTDWLAPKEHPPLQVGVSAAYLLAAFEAFTGEDVNAHLTEDPNTSLYFTDCDAGHHQAVVMPMRL